MFTKINLVLSTLPYYHNTYGNWHTINGALNQEFLEGKYTLSFSASLDKKPAPDKGQQCKWLYEIPCLPGTPCSYKAHQPHAERWGRLFQHPHRQQEFQLLLSYMYPPSSELTWTVLWHFNTQGYSVPICTPKELWTEVMLSLQTWHAVHVSFSHLLLPKLQRRGAFSTALCKASISL